MESYRCHRVFITATQAERIVNTVTWRPTKHIIPIATPTDLLTAAIKDLRAALHMTPPGVATPHLKPTQVQALKSLALEE